MFRGFVWRCATSRGEAIYPSTLRLPHELPRAILPRPERRGLSHYLVIHSVHELSSSQHLVYLFGNLLESSFRLLQVLPKYDTSTSCEHATDA